MTVELTPRHLQLRDLLFRRWKTAGLKAGDKIESQNEITKFCDFSLITVIKTLKDLEAEGIIRRQVGRGSFLEKAPWAEAHHRVGFFYNRNIVGGGIFDNVFYTRMVTALERSIVSDGHEFFMGSFTHEKMPVSLWDRLDMVLLAGITAETDISAIGQTTSQVSVLDAVIEREGIHSYTLDYGTAFTEMFATIGQRPNRVLYLDTVHISSEQARRLAQFKAAAEASEAVQTLSVLAVNQEDRDADIAPLEAAIAGFQPEFICGYMHHGWQARMAEASAKPVRIYPYGLDSSRPGFVVEGGAWLKSVVPTLYRMLEDRPAEGSDHSFPAHFVP
ncbi:MAG: GntR family transcriptional regulator [Devosia sp.]|uniref:Regulatory protein, gntR family n=1 Tax=Devosia enhydra TaxID=665118 RepID=A0A1K2HZB9_9HYPH|nr:GntR family transcriptional regulator [Devosia enhydra]SFZ85485.1 regulatory protein, gntR family [Devosia enhydra]